MKVLLLIASCLSFSLMAQELRLDQNGGPMENVPVKNQGRFGTCYAYSVAQAVDTHISITSKEDFNTSPLMIAINMKDTFWKRVFKKDADVDGGWLCPAFKKGDSLRHEFCSEDVIEKDLMKLIAAKEIYPNYDNFKMIISSLETIYDNYQSLTKKDQKQKLENYAQKIIDYLSPTPNIKSDYLPSIKEASIALKSRNNLQYLARLFKSRCQSNSQIVDNVRCESMNRKNISEEMDKKIEKEIDSILESHSPHPVMMAYCSEVLLQGKTYRGVIKKGLSIDVTSDCGGHASLIIGKRVKNNITQYLVRNSWGERCDFYSEDFECDKGNIWVDKESLIPNIFQIAEIK